MRVLLMLLALTSTTVWADSTIRVLGQGVASASPDHARMTFAITRTAPDARDAQQQVEQLMTAVIDGLDEFALRKDSLQAANLNVVPQYRWLQDRRERELVGYEVTRRGTFVLDNLEQLGTVYQVLVELGATGVDPARLGTRDSSRLAREAMRAAYKDAENQASHLATAAGGELGAPLEIKTVNVGPSPQPMMARLAADAETSNGPIYSAGTLDISRQIEVVFSLIVD